MLPSRHSRGWSNRVPSGYPSSAVAASVACLSAGADLPVRNAWLTARSVERSRRTSSPGTSWSVGTSRGTGGAPALAWRSTVVVVASVARRAGAARPARCSWATRRAPPVRARVPMTAAARRSPVPAETLPSPSRVSTNGSASARSSRTGRLVRGGGGRLFSPCRASRACASLSTSPCSEESSCRRTSSGAIPARRRSRADTGEAGRSAGAGSGVGGRTGRGFSGAEATPGSGLLRRAPQVGDHLLDHHGQVRVVDQVHLVAALAPGLDEPGQPQLGQVLADRLDRRPDLLGERTDIPLALREQPHDVQPHGSGEDAEGTGGGLEELRRQLVHVGAAGLLA